MEKNDVRYEEKDVENFEAVMRLLEGDADLPMNETIVKVAKHFLGTPYVSGTLDKYDTEKLTVNTRETDCILFVEMCLAMSLTSKDANPTFDKYIENLKNLRYRNGKVDGYTSRLHYTSEWISQGSRSGVFHEISHEIGGTPLAQHFFFMSTHPGSYRQLKEKPSLLKDIRLTEKTLEIGKYFYLPKSQIDANASKISDGDILCLSCNIEGLDITHVVLAYHKPDGTLSFIHASSSKKKVVIEEKSLAEYTVSSKIINGIRVLRLDNR